MRTNVFKWPVWAEKEKDIFDTASEYFEDNPNYPEEEFGFNHEPEEVLEVSSDEPEAIPPSYHNRLSDYVGHDLRREAYETMLMEDMVHVPHYNAEAMDLTPH